MTYQPNWNDPRIQRRTKQALCWAHTALKTERTISHTTLNKHIGRTNEPLGNYLRQHILITTADWYHPDAHITKKYRRNEQGIRHLAQQIGDTEPNIALQELERTYQAELLSGDYKYQEKTYRYWHPLQNLSSEHRNILLHKYGYKYYCDINAAAPNLLLQLAQRNGYTAPTPSITEYLTKKTYIRRLLATELEIPPKNIKQLLHAIMMGATIGTDNQYRKYATYELLEHDPARVLAINGRDQLQIAQHHWIGQYKNDWRCIWQHLRNQGIIPTEYIQTRTGRRRAKIRSTHKANTYFRLEHQVITAIHRYLELTANPHLLLHDGYYCQGEPDIQEIQDYITNTTGYTMSISIALLC